VVTDVRESIKATAEMNGQLPDEEMPAVVALEQFIAVDEPGATGLLGTSDQALIPDNGDVMAYGDGGAGKTTLCIDLAFHLATGQSWLGIAVTRRVHVLLIENEGPRPLYRAKLRRKLEAWPRNLDGQVDVWEQPWTWFTFADADKRQRLADEIRDREIDVLIVGPVSRAGMNDAGTLQEIRDFMELVADVRQLSGRAVAIILIHHENKGGKVSGAWEGSGDTLLHVQGQGHGRTRLYIQKARWASEWHAKTLNLVWADGESFTVQDPDEVSDDQLADQILAVISSDPGTGWVKVEKAIKGVGNDKLRDIRDGLLAAGRIVNIVKTGGAEMIVSEVIAKHAARLYLADDPTIHHLCQTPGTVPAQSVPATGAGPIEHLCRVPGLKAGTRLAQMQITHPTPPPLEDAGWE
jgi:archaellum biogenesis ATPase FlaH